LEVASPFVHSWFSIRRACWTLGFTLFTFWRWCEDPVRWSKQTRREALAETEEAREQSCSPCRCRFCKGHRANGEDPKSAGARKDSSYGEMLVGGLEKRLIRKRVQHNTRPYSRPLVPVSSATSIPLTHTTSPQAPGVSTQPTPASSQTSILGTHATFPETQGAPAPPQAISPAMSIPVTDAPALHAAGAPVQAHPPYQRQDASPPRSTPGRPANASPPPIPKTEALLPPESRIPQVSQDEASATEPEHENRGISRQSYS